MASGHAHLAEECISPPLHSFKKNSISIWHVPSIVLGPDAK